MHLFRQRFGALLVGARRCIMAGRGFFVHVREVSFSARAVAGRRGCDSIPAAGATVCLVFWFVFFWFIYI